MNQANLIDFEEKRRRICTYLREKKENALVLRRRDSFAWATFGGDNKIFRSGDLGAGLLVFTEQDTYLFAYSMDADRIMEEELEGLPVEQITVLWNQGTLEEAVEQKLGDANVISDYPAAGWSCRFEELLQLRLPYTLWEQKRYEQVGALCDRLFYEAAEELQPGMTEQQAASILARHFEEEKMVPKVLLVGSDERITKYRHPLPSDKVMEHTVLLHVASDKYGMHGNITRMLCFGEIPGNLERDYELLNLCQASVMSLLKPGVPYKELLNIRRQILREAGKESEWNLHFPGATAGYFVGSSEPILGEARVEDTRCYDWFMTVTGAKVEELSMASPQGGKVLSAAGWWPGKEYQVKDYKCCLPVIMCR